MQVPVYGLFVTGMAAGAYGYGGAYGNGLPRWAPRRPAKGDAVAVHVCFAGSHSPGTVYMLVVCTDRPCGSARARGTGRGLALSAGGGMEHSFIVEFARGGVVLLGPHGVKRPGTARHS